MSIDDFIRNAIKMQQAYKSFDTLSKMEASIRDHIMLPSNQMDQYIREAEQMRSMLGLTGSSFSREFVTLNSSIEAIQESIRQQQARIDSIRPYTVALTEHQSSFLKSIQTIESFYLPNTIDQLSLQGRVFGEFEGDDDPKELFEGEEDLYESGLCLEIEQRLELVQFLPLRLLDAISSNPELMRGLDPRDFERLIADLLNAHEFQNIVLTPRSGDKGRDVLATKYIAGIPILFSFECKRYSNKVGVEVMRGLLGSVAHNESKANIGVLATTSRFTKGARDFILTEPLVDGKDFDDLVSWLNKYISLRKNS